MAGELEEALLAVRRVIAAGELPETAIEALRACDTVLERHCTEPVPRLKAVVPDNVVTLKPKASV